MSTRLKPTVLLLLLLLAAAGAILFLGHWEEQRSARSEMAEMKTVLEAVGPLSTTHATGYRLTDLHCLAYPTPQNRLGLQLCFDGVGRLVETVDRRGAQPVYASLAYKPSLSTIRSPSPLIDRLIARAAP